MNIACRRLIVSLLGAASLCAAATLPAHGAERGPRVRSSVLPAEKEARVIVTFKADSALMRTLSASTSQTRPQHAQTLGGRLGLSMTDGRILGPRTQVLKAQGLSSQQLVERLSAQADVESAEVDVRMRALAAPNDPLYGNGQSGAGVPAVGQWYLRAPPNATIASVTSVVSSINAEAAWSITTGSSSVIVAVLDTGIRPEHPDLAGKLLAGYDFVSTASTTTDTHQRRKQGRRDGRDSDPTDPGDFGCDGETTSSWHGTQTSGLIGAATDNNRGMASVGRNVKVLPLRVLGCGGTGYSSDIQAAMLWAAGIHVDGVPDNLTQKAKVLNLSLGGAGACGSTYTSVIKQVNDAGAVVVVAAGNDGLDVGSPANCPGAIAVAGLRHSGTKVGYSDLGPTVAIAAPAGNCVNATGECLYPLLSTSNDGATTPGNSIYTGTGANATLGTSFSAPLVAGHGGADVLGESLADASAGADGVEVERASIPRDRLRSGGEGLHRADERRARGGVLLHDHDLRRRHAGRWRRSRVGGDYLGQHHRIGKHRGGRQLGHVRRFVVARQLRQPDLRMVDRPGQRRRHDHQRDQRVDVDGARRRGRQRHRLSHRDRWREPLGDDEHHAGRHRTGADHAPAGHIRRWWWRRDGARLAARLAGVGDRRLARHAAPRRALNRQVPAGLGQGAKGLLPSAPAFSVSA